MSKNVYLEVGVYSLYWINEFYNSHKEDEWHFELFEPNPICINSINKDPKKTIIPNINLNCVAATAASDKRRFYLGKGRGWQGSASLFGDKCHVSNRTTHVNCIDFNQWILDNLNKDDNIYMNMDIEGAEYEVIPHMIKGGSIHYINSITVEFHLDKFREGSESKEKFYKTHEELKLFFDTFNTRKALWRL